MKKILKILENEKYFDDGREFERFFYPLLKEIDPEKWLELSSDNCLSKVAKARAAYVYTFKTSKYVKLDFKLDGEVGFFHRDRPYSANDIAKNYGFKNGINEMRYNQFIQTGSF